MKMKRLLAIVLAVCLLMTLAACSGDGDSNTTTTGGDTATTTTVNQDPAGDEPVVDDDTTTTAATDENGETVTTTVATDAKGNVITTTTKKGATTTTVRTKKQMVNGSTATIAGGNSDGTMSVGAPITVKEGTTPLEKGMNFGGETFSYAYYGTSWSAKHKTWFADFEKLYNCKMDVRGVAEKEYTASIASAMASGEPYDLVFLHGFNYPSQITANTMMPLDDYITTADLWTDKSATEGGFSYSLMEATSLNGHIYGVAGTYLNTPLCLYYNKKIFADAGYDGADDPLALYKAGKWTWNKLYDILSDIQDPEKGLYGMNTISPYYDHYLISSYGTDLVKLTSNGKMVQNLSDPQLYKAFETLQKFSYGEHRVTDPKNQFEKGIDQFLNGTTALWMYNVGAYSMITTPMAEKTYSAFGTKATQLSNVGFVPVPTENSQGLYPCWNWIAYGVGNGTDAKGRDFALAFAKYDSIVNQVMTYTTDMPAEMQKISRSIMDTDKLIAPQAGFESSAGSIGDIETSMSSKIAIKGQNITVTLKAYEKVVQTVIDQALKG